MRHLYLAWVPYQRRPDSMRGEVGYALHFIPPPYQSRWLKPLGYIQQAHATWQLISRVRPDVVWYQSPPTFLAHLLGLYRVVTRHRFAIIADCHNAALRAPWARIPFTSTLLNRFDLVLAHNEEVRDVAVLTLGLSTRRLVVLETRPAQLADADGAHPPQTGPPLVFVPTSFSADEPVDALLQAAHRLPKARFVLTGRLSKARSAGYVDRAPANVEFTDYIPVDRYNALLRAAHVVVGLTTCQGIQLSAANEAVGAGRPLVLSDTRILRTLFGDAALFAANEPTALASTIGDALCRTAELATKTQALRLQREQRWRRQLDSALAAAGLQRQRA